MGKFIKPDLEFKRGLKGIDGGKEGVVTEWKGRMVSTLMGGVDRKEGSKVIYHMEKREKGRDYHSKSWETP